MKIEQQGEPTPPATPQPIGPLYGVVESRRVHVADTPQRCSNIDPATRLQCHGSEGHPGRHWVPVDVKRSLTQEEADQATRAVSPPDVEQLTTEQERARFEAWIQAPPYERDDVARYSAEQAWPGHYVDYELQLAWEAWQAALSPSTPGESKP